MEKVSMKSFCFSIISLFLVSCATPQADTSIIGVYKPIDKKCNGPSYQMESCNNIQLLEFVYGNFYQIAKNEIAFVVWSGESKEDLLYVANKTETAPDFSGFPKVVTLTQEDSFIESVQFINPNSITYFFGNPNGQLSTINLKRLSSREVSSYKIEYPGSD